MIAILTSAKEGGDLRYLVQRPFTARERANGNDLALSARIAAAIPANRQRESGYGPCPKFGFYPDCASQPFNDPPARPPIQTGTGDIPICQTYERRECTNLVFRRDPQPAIWRRARCRGGPGRGPIGGGARTCRCFPVRDLCLIEGSSYCFPLRIPFG